MKYTQVGEHELTYTAVDECGNTTVQTRKVIAYDYATVLFEDGTLIINEHSTDRASNIALHGDVEKEYTPLDENNGYVFNNSVDRPWHEDISSILRVKFGSEVAPTTLQYWFQQCSNLVEIDYTNLVTDGITSVRAFVSGAGFTTFSLPEMPNLESIQYVCRGCVNLASVDFSHVNSSKINMTQDAFQGCSSMTVCNLASLTGTVTSALSMFADITGENPMSIVTIYADPGLDFSTASGANMFRSCSHLVGAIPFNGTTDNTYANVNGYFTDSTQI